VVCFGVLSLKSGVLGVKSISELMEVSGVGFGTSGARGLVEAMSDEVCYLYTAAFLQYLSCKGDLAPGSTVAVAGDLRPSTPRILSAVICAIESMGYRSIFCGFIPSPAVALYGIEQGIPSIMVTGSHIPDDRNGIKFNRADGEILKSDEAGIRSQSVVCPDGLFDEKGSFIDERSLPPVIAEATAAYLSRYLDLFSSDLLGGARIGVYEHSGVARDILPEILTALGADVVCLGRSEQFIPVDTEAIRPEDVELAKQWVDEHQLDATVSTDGDADRPLVSDENGIWLRGDVAGILTAKFLGADSVVTPVSSNSAVERCGYFPSVIRTRIGSPYVIEAMQQALDSGGGTVVGYEANGGFLQASTVSIDGGELSPLPTRDAVIVTLSILAMSRQQGVPVSRLVAGLPERYTHSDRLKEFPVESSQKLIGSMASGVFADDAAAFHNLFGNQLGEVAAIDYTDGVRFTLSSGEVVHLRPSGNAPELRCYTEADTVLQAVELNAFSLKLLRAVVSRKS